MKKVTREELQQIVIDELAQFDGSEGVSSIGIIEVNEPGLPNWTHGDWVDFGKADRGLCLDKIPQIVQRLQEQYELE